MVFKLIDKPTLVGSYVKIMADHFSLETDTVFFDFKYIFIYTVFFILHKNYKNSKEFILFHRCLLIKDKWP